VKVSGSPGLLFILSGPSGTGKTTLCKELVKRSPELHFSVSCTTRTPRKDEVMGRDYVFVSLETFKAMIERGEFAEWARIYGNYYGTPRATIEQILSRSEDLLFDIDCQGARQLKESYPEGISIFVLPPSLSELAQRLEHRNTDASEAIQDRLGKARMEIDQAKDYDYLVVNEAFPETVRVLLSIIVAEKHRTEHLMTRLSLLAALSNQ
jgi:guanylate kinase